MSEELPNLYDDMEVYRVTETSEPDKKQEQKLASHEGKQGVKSSDHVHVHATRAAAGEEEEEDDVALLFGGNGSIATRAFHPTSSAAMQSKPMQMSPQKSMESLPQASPPNNVLHDLTMYAFCALQFFDLENKPVVYFGATRR